MANQLIKKWLLARWDAFFPALEAAGSNEDAIAQLCQEEIATWRARPTMKEATSLRTPLTDTRNKIRELPLTDGVAWRNPRTGAKEHLALRYLDVSEAEWARMNAPSEASAQKRREEQQFFADPDAIVAQAVALLKRDTWSDIAAGLAVLTGRRVGEVLKTGVFLPKTRYTVTFVGQLKRRDKTLDPYEIPTLCEARFVLEAIARLRSLRDCSAESIAEVDKKYTQAVREAAAHWFGPLLPERREGHADIYTHLFRCLYGQIAVLYYAPLRKNRLDYMSQIYGHYWIINAETLEKKRNYQSTMHYDDYRILDEQGQIDGRQGIKIGEPGVCVLEVFQQPVPPQALEEEEAMSEVEITEAGALPLQEEKKHSIIRVTAQTRQLFNQEAKALGIRDLDETQVALITRSVAYRQLLEALAPLAPLLGMAADAEPLAIIAALQDFKPAPARVKGGKKTVEQHELEALLAGLRKDGTAEPVAYLRGLVEKEAHFRAGLKKRHAEVEYQTLTLEQLDHIKTTESANERFRRAVDAIMAHNAAMKEEPLKQWYINPGSVRELVGGRHPAAKAYIESRAQEIEAHHTLYQITPVYNRKPPIMGIATMVKLEGVARGEPEATSEEGAEGEG